MAGGPAIVWRSPSVPLAGSALVLLALNEAAPGRFTFLPWVIAALLALALASIHRADWRRRQARHAEFFADCLGLLDSYRVEQVGLAYPVIAGRYRGFEVRLEPVVDHIAWRKLPSLWLKATVIRPMPYAGVLDVIARPQGVEFYSPSDELNERLPAPASWPAGLMICTDDVAAMPPLALVEPHIALFDDPQMKELLVTPRGVRLVRQVWQGERAAYLVLRQVQFAESRLRPAVARAALDAALALAETLDKRPQLAKAS
jgi:hypothetical protein